MRGRKECFGSGCSLSKTCLPAHSRPDPPGRRQQGMCGRQEVYMKPSRLLPAVAAVGVMLTACGGGGGGTTTTATVPSDLSISVFDANFTYMPKLKDLAAAGNVKVGELIGKGFVQCVTDWSVKNPQVFELDGGQNSDPNAVSFAQGYNDAIWGKKAAHVDKGTTNSQGMKLVDEQVATDWKNDVGQTIFQQAYTANAAINATVEANDGLGNAVVTVLKSKGVKAKSVPTTGQDATPDGIANVLTDFQCGSVYKAVYLEAQAAVALATVLRASATPPSALVNGTTSPPSGVSGNQQPAILLVPIWVTKANMKDTVIKDNFVDKTALCQKVTAAVCSAAGIS